MNNTERQQWIDNDEGLYEWYRRWARRNTGGRQAFIREHRAEIDAAIVPVLAGEKPAHHLKYG